jgi:hypothetical protein
MMQDAEYESNDKNSFSFDSSFALALYFGRSSFKVLFFISCRFFGRFFVRFLPM